MNLWQLHYDNPVAVLTDAQGQVEYNWSLVSDFSEPCDTWTLNIQVITHCYAYLVRLVGLVIILIQKMLPDEFSDEGRHGDDPKSVYIDEVSQCLSVCTKNHLFL